jgi:hypothetical protein
MPVTFSALGGLANRLRAIFSRYEPGMQVVWTRTWDIAMGHFLEVFEPVPGLEFVEPAGRHIDSESWHAAINYENWHKHYKLLRPTTALRERIMGLQDAMGPYVAMHVRRTDHVRLAHAQGRYTTDAEFVEWAKARVSPVFVATDNVETREVMQRALPAVIWQGAMQPSTALQHESRRYNSLADAVVDMWLCVRADEFMGSAHSSFSELVGHLRGLQ